MKTLSGKILVDIREYYTKDGNTLPGKKGFTYLSQPFLLEVIFCGALYV